MRESTFLAMRTQTSDNLGRASKYNAVLDRFHADHRISYAGVLLAVKARSSVLVKNPVQTVNAVM